MRTAGERGLSEPLLLRVLLFVAAPVFGLLTLVYIQIFIDRGEQKRVGEVVVYKIRSADFSAFIDGIATREIHREFAGIMVLRSCIFRCYRGRRTYRCRLGPGR